MGTRKGAKRPDTSIRNILVFTGKPAWNKGLVGRQKMSKETRRKMSLAKKGKRPKNLGISFGLSGIGNVNWQGGISFEPYSLDWKSTLKKSIRERDKYLCQLCFNLQDKELLSVHHIDYDKKNCNPNNLISLCRSCHSKTNKDREYWKNYFKIKL